MVNSNTIKGVDKLKSEEIINIGYNKDNLIDPKDQNNRNMLKKPPKKKKFLYNFT